MNYFRFTIIVLVGLLSQSCKESASQHEDRLKPSSTALVTPYDSISVRIAANPNSPGLYYQRAKSSLNTKDWQAAMNDIDRSIKLDSANGKWHLFKAKLYRLANRMGPYRAALEKGIELDPSNTDLNYALGYLFLAAKNYEEAIAYANASLKEDVHYAPGYFLKGLIYKDRENYTLAVSSFQTAIEQDANYYEAYVELGLLYALADDPLAVDYYKNALDSDSTGVDALYNLGMWYQNHGDPRKALDIYGFLVYEHPSFYNGYYNRGYIYLEQLNELDSAIIEFDDVIRINPMNYRAFYNRGLARERLGKSSQALSDYNRALAIKPDFDLAAKGKSRVE